MKDVRQAYRKLALKYHPDRDLSQPSGDQFKLITDAYQFLRDHGPTDSGSTRKFSDLYPEEAVSYYDKADVLFAKHSYVEAIELYDKAISFLPRYEKAWLRKGDCFSNLKRNEDALECYDKVLEINVESVSAWNLKGICLSELKRYGEALVSFDEAILRNPLHEAMWNFRGVCLYSLKRYDEALDSFDKAIKINPDFAPSWRNKGNLLIQLGKKKEGKKIVEHAERIRA